VSLVYDIHAYYYYGNVLIWYRRYGVLTDPAAYIPPMHSFSNLNPRRTGPASELEFDLPHLDLDVSNSGIVGRQITVLGDDRELGMGIVGYN
jgi:hypothetical protein